jgi:hypothetical protein
MRGFHSFSKLKTFFLRLFIFNSQSFIAIIINYFMGILEQMIYFYGNTMFVLRYLLYLPYHLFPN